MIEGIWLVHPEQSMCDAFAERFRGLPGVRIVQSRFEDLEPHDGFVTAGNAFGLMESNWASCFFSESNRSQRIHSHPVTSKASEQSEVRQ